MTSLEQKRGFSVRTFRSCNQTYTCTCAHASAQSARLTKHLCHALFTSFVRSD
jgi:hypothetical protein